jgi:MFS family permease
MAQTTDIGQLSVLNGVSTYFAGMGIALINILAGLFAGETERGRVFGILGFASTLGGLIGGFGSGPIVDRWGFPALLQILAMWSVLFPLVALFAADKVVVRPRPAAFTPTPEGPRLGAPVYFLLLANIMVWLVGFTSSLARPLMMDQMGFDSTAISGAVGIGALATLPLAPMIGWLSDRLGRKRFLAFCYLAGGLGLLLLSVSVSVWHFWLSAALLALIGASGGVGLAQVADLAPRAALDRGISMFSSTTFIAGIIGSAGTGYLIRGLGMTPTLIVGAALALLAILLLSFVRPPALQPRVSSA